MSAATTWIAWRFRHQTVGMFTKAARGVARAFPEILTAGALLGGWSLVTLGIALLTSPLAWLFSGGLLLLSLSGWKLLYVLARDGLYALTRDNKRG